MDASDLYGLPTERFTAARNELAKRLKAAGQRQKASGVARLRKPPATAWALNHLARQDPEVVGAVFDAGSELRAAMDAALGGDASGVRAARTAEREAVTAAVTAGGRLLDESGHSSTDAALRRMEATLRAAMVDEAVADALRQGVLDRDHDAPGFGFDASALGASVLGSEPAEEVKGVAAAHDTKAAEREEAKRQAAAERAAARRAKLVEEADRLDRRADELDAAAIDAEAVAFRARRAADEAKAKATEARQAIETDDD
jgi:hypothetical protein